MPKENLLVEAVGKDARRWVGVRMVVEDGDVTWPKEEGS